MCACVWGGAYSSAAQDCGSGPNMPTTSQRPLCTPASVTLVLPAVPVHRPHVRQSPWLWRQQLWPQPDFTLCGSQAAQGGTALASCSSSSRSVHVTTVHMACHAAMSSTCSRLSHMLLVVSSNVHLRCAPSHQSTQSLQHRHCSTVIKADSHLQQSQHSTGIFQQTSPQHITPQQRACGCWHPAATAAAGSQASCCHSTANRPTLPAAAAAAAVSTAAASSSGPATAAAAAAHEAAGQFADRTCNSGWCRLLMLQQPSMVAAAAVCADVCWCCCCCC